MRLPVRYTSDPNVAAAHEAGHAIQGEAWTGLGGGYALNDDCINYMRECFPSGSKILELGSGEGTKALLEAGFEVFSIEQDPEWAFKYHENYILCPMKFNEEKKMWWYDHNCLADAKRAGKFPDAYDILLIDGPTGSGQEFENCRLGILDHLDIFNVEVAIFVDDIDRDFELSIFKELRKERISSVHGRVSRVFGSHEVEGSLRCSETMVLRFGHIYPSFLSDENMADYSDDTFSLKKGVEL